MKNEKNFYDIINAKFNSREIPFDEENWKEMKAMINASRSSDRRTLWLVASLSLLLIAGGAFSIYNCNTVIVKSNAGISVTNSPKATKVTNNEQATNTIPAETTNTKVASNNNQPTIVYNTIAHTNQPVSNRVRQRQLASNNTSSHQKKTNPNGGNINKQSNPAIASNNTVSSDNKEQGNNTIKVATNNVAAVATKTETQSPAQTEQKTAATPNSLTSKAVASSAKATSHIADTATTGDTHPQRFSDEPRVFGGKTNLFSVELGTEYSLGWQTGTTIQAKGYNVIAGIGYSHYIGAKWFLKTGLQFSTFGNMSPFTYNYQHSVGKAIYDSVITTKRLYFLRIPVQAEYSFGRQKKSSVGFGGSVWFLLGSSGFATTYEQVDNNPPINVVQYNQNAELKGYSEVNASAHILYRYILSHKFSMYGIIYYEITNMKNNSFFGENIVHRTRGFQLTLSYNLN